MMNTIFMFSYSWDYICLIIIDQWADGFHKCDSILYLLLLKCIIYTDFSTLKTNNMHKTKII